MRQILYAFLLLLLTTVSANSIEEELDKIYPLLHSNPDSAFNMSLSVLEKAKKSDNYLGLSKSNYILGYLSKRSGDIGGSVIYYLEAIRYSDLADYENVVEDRIRLRKNLANTFRQFEANRLATQYNLEALEIATSHNIVDRVIDLKYRQAIVYQNNDQHQEAIQLMLEVLPQIENEQFKNRVRNQLGLVYLESGQFSEAEKCFKLLLDLPQDQRFHTAKALHNLGEIYYETGNRIKSIENLRQSLDILNSFEEKDNYSILLGYRNIGRYLYEESNISESLEFLKKAEEIADYGSRDASTFEIYKTFSALYYSIGEDDLGKQYSNTYFTKVEEYLQ